eukprot:s831_g1.t1
MGGGSSEAPAAAETMEGQTEGGTPGSPVAPKLGGRGRSRSFLRELGESAPSGSAPSSAAVPVASPPATTPPAKPPPKRKAAGADDGVTGAATAALKEARTNSAKAKENDESSPGDHHENKPVILPRSLLHRLGALADALQQQGLLNERYMAQSHSDLEKCARSLADLYQTIKVPTDMFAHMSSLADGVSFYASEVKRMLSVKKWNWDWLQPTTVKKPMTAYIKELINSAAAAWAATLGIQADMAKSKEFLKSLLEVMERTAVGAEKTSTFFLHKVPFLRPQLHQQHQRCLHLQHITLGHLWELHHMQQHIHVSLLSRNWKREAYASSVDETTTRDDCGNGTTHASTFITTSEYR